MISLFLNHLVSDYGGVMYSLSKWIPAMYKASWDQEDGQDTVIPVYREAVVREMTIGTLVISALAGVGGMNGKKLRRHRHCQLLVWG